MDAEEGREGGTWLAMHTKGKVVALLNALKPLDDEVVEAKKPRGLSINSKLTFTAICYHRQTRLENDSSALVFLRFNFHCLFSQKTRNPYMC